MRKKRKQQVADFFATQKYYAHRGLHDGLRKLPFGEGVPENSLKAFDLACKEGYGIEFDVHATADGKLVVFHDDTLDRMCGVSGKIEEMTLEELRKLKLNGTEEGIPTFEETLALIDGRAQLVIELKGKSTKDMRVCELTEKVLRDYKGSWCVESFNPFHVKWWRKNRKDAVRGILSCKMAPGTASGDNFTNFVLQNMLLNFLGNPDFVAYEIESKNLLAFKTARALGRYPVGWTARGEKMIKDAEKDFKAIIFEK